MAFSYTLGKVGVEARDTVRALVRDTKSDRPHLQDEEITALLLMRGLTAKSDPVANRSAIFFTAADAARMIEAKFASESEIALTQVGVLKNNAAGAFSRLAKELDAQAIGDAAPSFHDAGALAGADSTNPSGYPNDWVAGVDPVPGYE